MKRESHIDPLLERIEFPGEEEGLIRTWLQGRDFADSVVRESRRLRVVSRRSVFWASATVAVVAAGVLAGGSPVFAAAGGGMATFASLLLGVLVTVAVIGLIGTLHPSWHREHRTGRLGTRHQMRP